MAVTVTMVWPRGVGTVTWKLPSVPATACMTDVVLASEPGWPTATSTVAPGVVFPATDAWLLVVAVLDSWLARMSSVMPGGAVEMWPGVVTAPGAVTRKVSGTTVGAPRATYRACVVGGWSTRRLAARSRTSLTYWACAQISGSAEPAASPLRNPIDATAGSLP